MRAVINDAKEKIKPTRKYTTRRNARQIKPLIARSLEETRMTP
jgi:hypothetical protein